MRTQAALAFALALGWVPGSVDRALASCLAEPPELVTLQVERCEDVESFRDRRLEKAGIPWLVEVAVEVVERYPGIVLSGTVTDAQELDYAEDGSVTLGAFRLAEERGAWFLGGATAERCEAWPEEEPAATVRLVRHKPCCDVIPPYDVPCLFGVGLVTDVPDGVAVELR